MDTFNKLVADKSVVIFSKSNCCMCHTIKTLVCSFGANPTVYELDELQDGEQLEKALVASGQRPSVLAVFIGQELVGGEYSSQGKASSTSQEGQSYMGIVTTTFLVFAKRLKIVANNSMQQFFNR